MVCRIFVTPIIGFAHLGARVNQIPVGTAIIVANAIAAAVSHTCSAVSVAISSPYCARNSVLIFSSPGARFVLHAEMPARNPAPPPYPIAGIRAARDTQSACLHSAAQSGLQGKALRRDRASLAGPSF